MTEGRDSHGDLLRGRVAALKQTLQEAERELKELLSSQGDALDRPDNGGSLLLDDGNVAELQGQLSSQSRRLRAAHSIANIGGWEFLFSDQKVRWSDEACQLLGVNVDEFPNTFSALVSLVHESDRMALQDAWQRCVAEKSTLDIDVSITRPDGKLRHILLRGEVHEDKASGGTLLSGSVVDVTERKRSETERDQMFKYSIDLVSVVDFDGVFLRVNPSWEETLGWSAEELVNHSWRDLIHPDDKNSTIEASARLLRGETVCEFENRIRCKDGSYRVLSWNAYPHLDTKQVFSVARDVTERSAREEMLRESEERFRLMIEGSEQVMFFSHDKDHYFTYISPSVSNVLGYEPEQLLGTLYDALVDLNDPVNVEAVRRSDQALAQGVSGEPYTLAVLHKEGHRIFVEIVESPITQSGEVVGMKGFARDISLRVQTQQNLADSEARFRHFFDQAVVGMVIASEDGYFLRANHEFARIIGYSEEEIVGQSCSLATHPSDRAHEDTMIAQMLAGTRKGGTWEKRYLRKDGTSIWCVLSLALMGVKDGERQFIGVVEDISKRKQAEEILQQNQALLRMAGEAAKLGGWAIDLENSRVEWSEQAYVLHEVPPDFQPTLENAIAFYPEEYREEVANMVRRCIHDGEPFNFEHELITAKGRRIWVMAIGEAVYDDAGNIVGVQGAFQDITQRKEAEASVVESQRRFRAVADSFPFIVWTAQANGEVDYSNRKFLEYTNVDPDAPPGSRWQPFVHPDDLPEVVQAWQRSVTSGESYSQEYRLRNGVSGEYRWYRVQAETFRDAQGEILKWYGTGLDVHESKALEQQARELADRLHDTLESITDGFFVLSRDWTFTYLNSQAEALLGRSRGELLGKNVWQEFPRAVARKFLSNYENAVTQGVSVHFEEYYPAPLDCWYEVSAYPNEEGLAVYFRDITKARESLSQLRLLEAAVARLNDIILITEGDALADSGPRIVFVNEAFERHTGYSQEEVIGKTPRILQGPKTQRKELDRIREALVKKTAVRAELINYTKAGDEFWVELDIVPLIDEQEEYTHWVAVQRDVTERHRLSEQLQRSQRLESVGQLTGGVAHDFNNLLTVILGNAEILAEELAESPHEEVAEMIVGAAQRGADLTQRLLAFARRQALEPKPVDIKSLIAGMESLLKRTLGEHVEIEFIQDNELWLAMIDPSQLENTLLNLCLNSRDAMRGGGRLTIETANVELSQDYADQRPEVIAGEYVMLAVSDTGSGISKEIIEQVFEPFFTTKDPGKGTGLGLAMLYGFIKQSGGHVSIYSELNEGTTVKLYLPRSNETAMPAEGGQPKRIEAGGRERILLVEDDELVLQYASSQLRSLGYHVSSVTNGLLALEILRTKEPVDLLFTDVVMPVMSGKKLVEEALKIRPELKVLYTSGYTENAIVHHGRLDQGVHLLSKPYRRVDLAQKVREVLDN